MAQCGLVPVSDRGSPVQVLPQAFETTQASGTPAKGRIRLGWVVVDALTSEPVSGPASLLSGKRTGKIRKTDTLGQVRGPETPVISKTYPGNSLFNRTGNKIAPAGNVSRASRECFPRQQGFLSARSGCATILVRDAFGGLGHHRPVPRHPDRGDSVKRHCHGNLDEPDFALCNALLTRHRSRFATAARPRLGRGAASLGRSDGARG